jgi:hypothetical protein
MTFLNEIGKQEGKTGPVWKTVISRRGKELRKMYRKVNIMEILYTHECKWKNGTDETVRNMGRVSKRG